MAARIILAGRATGDAVSRNAAQRTVAEFTIAVSRRFDKEKADYHRVVVFDRMAEFVLKYVKKGSAFLVSGALVMDSYTDKNGSSQKTTVIYPDKIDFTNGENDCIAVIEGHATRDAEIRYITGEKTLAVAHYSIAVSRGKDKDGNDLTDFYDIVTFGKDATFAQDYIKKGSPIMVRGELQHETWKDKAGNDRHSPKIVSERICLGSRKKDGDGGDGAGDKKDPPPFGKFMSVPDTELDELPFI